MGRLVRPDEVARTIAFLTSEDSGFTTGHYLPVNGGLSWIEYGRTAIEEESDAHDRPGLRRPWHS